MNDNIRRLFDENLKTYQIIVIDRVSGEQLFVGTDRKKVIYLEYSDKHYNLITSMPGYRCRHCYCKYCNRGYHRKDGHHCENGCRMCNSPFKCKHDGNSYFCGDCNVEFKSLSCFERHHMNVCQIRKKCLKCEMLYPGGRNHICGVYDCIKF